MRVRLRQHDFLTDEAAALDRMVLVLRRRVRASQLRAVRLERALAALDAELPGSIHLTAQSQLRAAQDEARRLARHLSRFQTSTTAAAFARHARPATDPGQASSPGATRAVGFTLLEIVVVFALIGTLAGIGVPLYGEALNRARVVRAIAEIRKMAVELQQYQIANGDLPLTLAQVGLGTGPDPWGSPYQYLKIAGLKGKGAVRKDHKLNPINADYDLFSMGRNRTFKTQVSQKDSLDDVIRANNGGFIGLAREY
jgi:general secretion pathway protein G